MPRLNRGAVGAIAGYVEDQRKRREEEYKSDREFQQRLTLAGLQSALTAGDVRYDVESGRFETPTMQASGLLERNLPQGPFVPGPEGGFIASATGGIDAAPNTLIPRPQVVQSLAPSMGAAMTQQRQLKPVYQQTETGLTLAGNVPKGAQILPARSKAALDFSDYETPETSIDPKIQQRIEQLRASGMSDQQIATYLIEKGIDPSVYGL